MVVCYVQINQSVITMISFVINMKDPECDACRDLDCLQSIRFETHLAFGVQGISSLRQIHNYNCNISIYNTSRLSRRTRGKNAELVSRDNSTKIK